MATPTLKYVAPTTAEADLSLAPEPVVIYGVPGGGDSGIQSVVAGTNVTVDSSDPKNPVVSATGGGGGGAVDSVNGETGAVSLNLDDVVSVSGIVEGSDKFIGLADNLGSLNELVQISPSQIQVQNIGSSQSLGLTPQGVQITSGASGATLLAPSSGSSAQVRLPGSSGTIALSSQIPDTSSLVPNTRTVAGKPLSSNISLDKIDVGLSNVDNISAANAPVSTATQTALNLKANTADVVPSTRTVAGKALSSNVTLVKGDVGLGNVDNTADTAKPISTATQTALNAKVGSPNSTITGVAYYPTVASLPTTGTAGVIYYVDAV